jgi:hypothetical protein
MNGVVAAQGTALGEAAGGSGERGVDGDLGQLLVDLIDRANRSLELSGVESAVAMRRRDRSTRLWIDDLPRACRGRPVPQLVREVRSGLVEDELDQRRGVEVDDQRRCSATRSDTDPAALIRRRPLRRRLGRVGSCMSPRARRSASGSTSSIADRRATRRPRIVTTTSPPSAACLT